MSSSIDLRSEMNAAVDDGNTTASATINFGTKGAWIQVRRYLIVICAPDILRRRGASEWISVQVQAKVVQKQAHKMSHAGRLIPSNCQSTRAVELQVKSWRTKKSDRNRFNIERDIRVLRTARLVYEHTNLSSASSSSSVLSQPKSAATRPKWRDTLNRASSELSTYCRVSLRTHPLLHCVHISHFLPFR